MHELEEKREEVKAYSKLILELEKQKINSLIVKREECLLKESNRLQLLTNQHIETYEKLSIYNKNLKETLKQETSSYEKMLNENPDVLLILDQNNEKNVEKYWSLIEKKEKLEKQIHQISDTSKM